MANTTADKLAKLNTTKEELKAAINGSGNTVGDVFSAYPAAITSGKTAIAQAITEKGVETEETDTFAQMAENIGQIKTGGGSGTATLTIDASNHFHYAYADEDGNLVNEEGFLISTVLTVPVPQVVFVVAVGKNERFNIDGDYQKITSVSYPAGAVIWMTGNVTAFGT